MTIVQRTWLSLLYRWFSSYTFSFKISLGWLKKAFYRPYNLPVTEPTVSKHCHLQLFHIIFIRTLNALKEYKPPPKWKPFDIRSNLIPPDFSNIYNAKTVRFAKQMIDVRNYVPSAKIRWLKNNVSLSVVLIYWRDVVVASLVSINEVNLRWARLVLGWVTVSGFDSQRRHFISVCNQPPRSTQPTTLCGTVKWVPAKGRWCSAAGE